MEEIFATFQDKKIHMAFINNFYCWYHNWLFIIKLPSEFVISNMKNSWEMY